MLCKHYSKWSVDLTFYAYLTSYPLLLMSSKLISYFHVFSNYQHVFHVFLNLVFLS